MYIFDCDRIIGDEEKRTIIENMEGKAEVIFDNSEGYDRDTDIVISTRCVRNKDVAGMEVIIREDIGVGCDYVGTRGDRLLLLSEGVCKKKGASSIYS